MENIQVTIEEPVPTRRDSVSSNDSVPAASSDEEKKLMPKPSSIAPRVRQDSGSSVDSIGFGEEGISEEMKEKIVTQAEFYFSDENLKRDGFLLKHVKRNKEGYVNLKLLASFKKMKSITKNFEIIAETLREKSTTLEMNETGLKIRRKVPLPKELMEMSRVKYLVVSQIPNENPTMDFITDAFTEHKEEIVSIRIVKPGKKFPNDLQSHYFRHPELAEEIVAVVEFDNAEVAAEALKTKFDGSAVYKGLKVELLKVGPKQANKKQKEGIGSEGGGTTGSDTPYDSESSVASKGRTKKKKSTGADRVSSLAQGLTDDSSYASSSGEESGGSNSPGFGNFASCSRRYARSNPSSAGGSPSVSPKMTRKQSNQLDANNNSPNRSPGGSPRANRKSGQFTPDRLSPAPPQHKISPLAMSHSPLSSPETRRRGLKQTTEASPGQNSWLQRRMMAVANKENTVVDAKNGNKHLEIVRQPRGPDGSIGFTNQLMKKYVLVHAY